MSRPVFALPLLIVLIAAGGCASGTAGGSPETRQPRKATYRCGGAVLVVENSGSSLTLTREDGGVSVLPAAPAGQTSRYGDQSQALVLDGREALWMAAGKAPANCKR